APTPPVRARAASRPRAAQTFPEEALGSVAVSTAVALFLYVRAAARLLGRRSGMALLPAQQPPRVPHRPENARAAGQQGAAAGRKRTEACGRNMISLVVPIYNEEALIERLHQEVVAALATLAMPWEVIYVDDGSSDKSLALLLQKEQQDDRVVVVEL